MRPSISPRGCAVPVLLLALALSGCPRRSDGGAAPGQAGSSAQPTPPTSPAAKPPPPDIPEQGALAQKILFEQAKGLLRADRAAQAIEVFRKSIAAHDGGSLLPSCYLGLASALSDVGRHEEAIETYRRVTTLRPDDPEAFRALAIGQEDAGQIKEAMASLERSLELDPSQLSAYQDLAALHLHQKEMDAAKSVFLRYELKRTELIRTLGLSRDDGARLRAAAALGDAKDEATARALGLALTDHSHEVRLAVIRSLGMLALPAGGGPLRELVARTKDPEEKRQAEVSLEAIRQAPPEPAQAGPASAPAPGKPRER